MERGQDFFDSCAAEWDKKRVTDKRRLEFLLSLINVPGQGRILDVGCGTGVFLEYLLRGKANDTLAVEAIDFSSGMLEIAKSKYEKHTNINFVCADIRQHELQAETYDLISCLNFFPHLTMLKEKEAYLCKTFRALKAGGELVIMHDISRAAVNGIHEHKPETFNDKLPSARDTGILLLKAGFSDVVGIEDDYLFFVRGKKTAN